MNIKIPDTLPCGILWHHHHHHYHHQQQQQQQVYVDWLRQRVQYHIRCHVSKYCWRLRHQNPSIAVDQHCLLLSSSSSSPLSSYVSCTSVPISIRLRNQDVAIEVHRQRPERHMVYTRDECHGSNIKPRADDINLISFQLSPSIIIIIIIIRLIIIIICTVFKSCYWLPRTHHVHQYTLCQ